MGVSSASNSISRMAWSCQQLSPVGQEPAFFVQGDFGGVGLGKEGFVFLRRDDALDLLPRDGGNTPLGGMIIERASVLRPVADPDFLAGPGSEIGLDDLGLPAAGPGGQPGRIGAVDQKFSFDFHACFGHSGFLDFHVFLHSIPQAEKERNSPRWRAVSVRSLLRLPACAGQRCRSPGQRGR